MRVTKKKKNIILDVFVRIVRHLFAICSLFLVFVRFVRLFAVCSLFLAFVRFVRLFALVALVR